MVTLICKPAIYITSAMVLASCANGSNSPKTLTISTNMGNIKVKLYEQTPNHSDNMLKLSHEKFFDGLIFHRVIDGFMIQGGDPNSRNPEPGTRYGDGDTGYLIDPEFCDTIIHQRGAIAMAREGDNVNPEKRSSGSQFYIVVGKVFTTEELDKLEQRMEQNRVNRIRNEISVAMLDKGIMDNALIAQKVDSALSAQAPFRFSEKQRKIYTTIGGTPHLDGHYTVFGEVVEGMDVVEKISKVSTDDNDRPFTDVKMKISVK